MIKKTYNNPIKATLSGAHYLITPGTLVILAGCHCACLYDLDQTNAHSPSMHTSVHKHTQDLWISFEDLRIGDRANEHSRQLLLFLFSWLHWRTLIAGLMQPRARKKLKVKHQIL